MMTTTVTRNDENSAAPTQRPDGARRRRFRRSTGGLGIAGALVVLGTAMMSNANYSDDYVTRQLVQQRITFKPVDALTDAERKSACVVANAGKLMTTGKQAECYANEFIGTHIKAIGGGRTYAQLEDVRAGLLAQIAAAQASGDPDLARLQSELGALTGQREAMFKAEMLRGILLTSFGFSTLGEKAGEAATAAYAAAGLMAALSIGGLAYAYRTPRTKTVPVEW
ncbi:MAG TPA: hypothetical protein VGV86_07170 [Acidimicrobiales bacterium]|nr:hypothetical protein [Acidimicrobiales bacterium]